MNFGTWELVLIFMVVLLVFGAKRIPEIARGLGKGIREFKQATREIQNELTIEEQQKQQIQPPRAQHTQPRSEATRQPASSPSTPSES